LADGFNDIGSLFAVIGSHKQRNFLTRLLLGEELFMRAVGVTIDYRHSAIQDGLGRAVVLLEQKRLRVLEISLKTLDVAVIGSAPAVDGLVFIPNGVDVVMALR